MTEEIHEFDLPGNPGDTSAIKKAILDTDTRSFNQPRGTETAIKVWFLEKNPYFGNSDGAHRDAIGKSFVPLTTPKPGELSTLQKSIMDSFSPLQNVANVHFEKANTEADADVLVGIYSDKSRDEIGVTLWDQNLTTPGTLKPRAIIGDRPRFSTSGKYPIFTVDRKIRVFLQ